MSQDAKISSWIRRIKEKYSGSKFDSEYVFDEPSRKIRGLFGREMDLESKKLDPSKGFAVVMSNSLVNPADAQVEQIIIKSIWGLRKAEIADRYTHVDINGNWTNEGSLEPILYLEKNVKTFLHKGTGNDLVPAWSSVMRVADKFKKKQMVALVLVSDFNLVGIELPIELKKMKFEILTVNLGKDEIKVQEFINANKDTKITNINLCDNSMP